MFDWSAIHRAALPYEPFLKTHASPSLRRRWDAIHARVTLLPDQVTLLGGFTRRIPVVCLAAGWCGDCMNQCPILDHFAAASTTIDLRFLEQEARPDVRDALMINGGHRLPVVVFLSEDWHEVARRGDRTLSIYRRLAVEQLGSTCPTGLVPPEASALATTTAEWLDEFERVQLILRLSPRLRERHGD